MPEEGQTEARPGVTVVTSDNFSQFVNDKLGVSGPEKADEPEPEAKEEVKEEKPEPKEEAKPDAEGEKLDKKEGKLNKRFSELTGERNQAREEAARERARAEAAERKAQELEAKLNPPKKEDEGPKRDQFSSDEEYLQARIDYGVEKKQKEEKQKEAQQKAVREREKTIKDFSSRQDAFKKETPDYEDKIESANVVVSNEVREMILESDVGPQILYHFAENPEEAERIREMTVAGAAKAIGKLEARLEGAKQGASKSEAKEAKEVPAPKVEISKAPAPINPLKGANAPLDLPINSKGEWTGDYQSFKKAVEEGKIK